MDKAKYDELQRDFGGWSSWAIWDEQDIKNTDTIHSSIDQLHTNYVIVALNISKELQGTWANFHFGNHDRKLRSAFNHADCPVRGCYMVDLFRLVEVNSSNVEEYFANPANYDQVLNRRKQFLHEMESVGASDSTVFVLMGGLVKRYFPFITDGKFKQVKFLPHYSYYGISDSRWKEQAYKILDL